MVHPRILPRATWGHGIAASSAAPRAAEGMAAARRGARISTRSWQRARTTTIARTIRRRSTRGSPGRSPSPLRAAPAQPLVARTGVGRLPESDSGGLDLRSDLLEWMQEPGRWYERPRPLLLIPHRTRERSANFTGGISSRFPPNKPRDTCVPNALCRDLEL